MIFFTAHNPLAASLLITIQTLFNCRLHITLFENNTISDSKVKWRDCQTNQRPLQFLNLRWAVLKQFEAVWFAVSIAERRISDCGLEGAFSAYWMGAGSGASSVVADG
jgi:hypothetical protein